MNIDKELLINVFRTGIFLDKALINRLGAEKDKDKERLLNTVIKMVEKISPKTLKTLKTETDIKIFIIDELKKTNNQINNQINNIVLIDRYTSQTLLKPFLTKNIFSGYTELKTRDEILKEELKKRHKEKFEIEEIREILSKIKEYKYNGYYIKDYKDYVIGFSARIYIDYIKKTEQNFIKEVSQTNEKHEKKEIEEVLKNLKLYKLAHKLAYVILGEVSIQKKYRNLEISKKRILELLGYTTKEKQIYQDIKEAIFSLRWLEFIMWDYTKTNKRAKKRDYARGITVGNFLNTLTEIEHNYIIDVNEKFVGCIQYIIENDAKNKKDKLNYFYYPLNNLLATKNYSDSAYFLNDFLIRESGNIKLNTDEYKIISYKAEKYIEEANIKYNHKTKKVRLFIKTLKELDIIEKIEPTINNLEKLKPKEILQTTLRIYIEKDMKKLYEKLNLQN